MTEKYTKNTQSGMKNLWFASYLFLVPVLLAIAISSTHASTVNYYVVV